LNKNNNSIIIIFNLTYSEIKKKRMTQRTGKLTKELPLELLKLISEYSKPRTRGNWRTPEYPELLAGLKKLFRIDINKFNPPFFTINDLPFSIEKGKSFQFCDKQLKITEILENSNQNNKKQVICEYNECIYIGHIHIKKIISSNCVFFSNLETLCITDYYTEYGNYKLEPIRVLPSDFY